MVFRLLKVVFLMAIFHLQAKKKLGSTFYQFPLLDSPPVPNPSNKWGRPVDWIGRTICQHINQNIEWI